MSRWSERIERLQPRAYSIGCLSCWAGILLIGWTQAAQLAAEDWPEWRGPRRDGISREQGWLDGWPEGAVPRVAWRNQVGRGHSAVSVADGRAYCLGWDGEQDTVFCWDARGGQLQWRQSYACETIVQWPGPRATATVHGTTVITLGQHGQLHAWHAVTGKPLWTRQLPSHYMPDVDYGFPWSPLVVGDLLLLNTGTRGLALRLSDGSTAWGDDGQKGACVSVVPLGPRREEGVLVVGINQDRSAAHLVGVDPRSGRELWRWDGWKEQWGALAVDPLVRDGRIFLTSAEQFRQAARFTITAGSLTQDWTTNRVAGYTGCGVLLDEHIYLVDGSGILKCVDWSTGEVKWNQRGFGERGSLSAAGGALLIQHGSSGELIVAAADPNGYRELRRAQVFTERGDTFTAPVLANGYLYCRSYAGEVVCLELR